MRKLVLAPVFAAAMLSGCGEETKSVDYYKAHLDEARDLSARCVHNAAAGENCGNAAVAIRQSAREQFDRDRERTAKALRDGTDRPTWNGH